MKLPLLLATSLSLFAPACADLEKIQGTWKASAGQIGEHAFPKTMLSKIVLIIKGDTYDYDEGNGHDVGSLKAVDGKPPLGMDILGTKGPNKGRRIPTIYKLDGSVLTICYGLDGNRPKSFTVKGRQMTLLMTFRRSD